MFQSFSPDLSAALVGANEEAHKLNQEFVGTEALLLGILAGESDAVRVLQNAVDIRKFKALLLKSIAPRTEPTMITGRLPLSPKVQQAIHAAVSQTQAAGEPNVSTRYVLLSLLAQLDQPESAVGEALRRSGVDFDSLRAELRKKPPEAK